MRGCSEQAATTFVGHAARQRFLRAVEHASRVRLKLVMLHDAPSLSNCGASSFPRLAALLRLLCGVAGLVVPVSVSLLCPSTACPHQAPLTVQAAIEVERGETCAAQIGGGKNKRFMYTWLRDARAPPICAVRVPDPPAGSVPPHVSFDPETVAKVLWSQWQAVFCPSPDQEPSPSVDPFVGAF